MDSKAALAIVAVSLVESAYCVTMYLPTWTCGGAIANRYILGRVKGLGACRSHVEVVNPAFRVTDSQRSIT